MINKKTIRFLSVLLLHVSFVLTSLGQITTPIAFPSSEPDKDEIRLAAIGDAGTGGKDQLKIARQLLEVQRKSNFSLLFFLGDNIYENGSPKSFEKKFLVPYGPLFRRGVEFRGVIGNHDARSDNGVLLQQMVLNMGTNTYYSFAKKNDLVEFFAIDSTEMAKGKNPERVKSQIEWFEQSLSKSQAKWKFVFLHHTIYSSADRHGLDGPDDDEMLRVRNLLEPLYIKYGVKVSLNGHDHVYERTTPQNGVTYFTSGAGAKLRKGNLQNESPFFAAGNDQVRSMMLFSIKPSSIRYWAIGDDGNILDSGIIE